jgi:hypothetical protein
MPSNPTPRPPFHPPPFVPTPPPPTAQGCGGLIVFPLAASGFDKTVQAHEAAHRAFSAFGVIP